MLLVSSNMSKDFDRLEDIIKENEHVYIDTNVVMEPRLAEYLRKVPRKKKRMTQTAIEEALTAGGSDNRFNTPRKKELIKSYGVENNNSEFYRNMMHGLINTNFAVNTLNEFFNQKESKTSKIYKRMVDNVFFLLGYQTPHIDNNNNNNNNSSDTFIDRTYDKILNAFDNVKDFNETTANMFKKNKKQKTYVKNKIKNEKKEIDSAFFNNRRPYIEKEPFNSLLHRIYNLTDLDIISQATEQEGLIITGDPDFHLHMNEFIENITPTKDNPGNKELQIYFTRENDLKSYSVPIRFEYDNNSLSEKLKKEFIKDFKSQIASHLEKEQGMTNSEANKTIHHLTKNGLDEYLKKNGVENLQFTEFSKHYYEDIKLPKNHNGHNLIKDFAMGTTAGIAGLAFLVSSPLTMYLSLNDPQFNENPLLYTMPSMQLLLGTGLANVGYKRLKNLKNTFEDFKKYHITLNEAIQSSMPDRQNNFHYQKNIFRQFLADD